VDNEHCAVGTFGQPDAWDIYDVNTFQHPMVPYDVLVDPLSLPSHPVIQERENVLDVLYGEPGDSSAVHQSDREQVTAFARVRDKIEDIIKQTDFASSTARIKCTFAAPHFAL